MQRITEIILFTILVTVFSNSQAIAAGQHWGDYQPGACDADTGKRKYSAILWDIPWGASWEDACEKMSAKIKEQNFAQPTQCINTGGHMWGEWLLTDPTCSKPVVDAGKQVGQHWGDYEHGACDADTGKRKYSAILWDIPGGTSWEDACNTMSSTINGFIFSKPTQCKVAGGHMWGEWVFADPTCAQPAVVAGKDIGSICKVTARNLNVDTQWQESELEALCQGTVDPYEPGQCYRMQENINLDYPVAFVEGTKAEKVSIGSDGSILRWNETDPNKIG
ncbi:hypothetical protein, partial [Methyloglobulus morosus]|uniref:hypothetical protein n=1 Tax=Methyloglobulus morosus TaxID=1410681 RepID=UPI00056088B3